jgi:molybdate transport system substrate-binding protein
VPRACGWHCEPVAISFSTVKSSYRLVVALLIIAMCLLVGGAVRADDPILRVSAAASLADALGELNAAFSKASGSKVQLNLGASSILARQIEQGAPADVFFSADQAKMDGLAAKGLVINESREDQLSNSLVVVIPNNSGSQFKSIQNLTDDKLSRIATGDPKAVPVGVYAKSYLEKVGLWKDIESKIVSTENVRGALAAVESGNVDAGIVYKTDAAISRKVKVALEFPSMEDLKIVYPIAVLKGAAQPKLAAQYLEYLDTPASKAVFEKFGFIVLPEMSGAK